VPCSEGPATLRCVLLVSISSSSRRLASATSCTARSKSAWFACDGLWNPLIFRTNCNAAFSTSYAVAGSPGFLSTLILLHILKLLFVRARAIRAGNRNAQQAEIDTQLSAVMNGVVENQGSNGGRSRHLEDNVAP
jgi:hypothetical protein